ncbi:MAG: TIGR02680 family protein [Actinophytocola sp.]|nr:TIGR02680 family protein [Actinophytocola sp.]
MTARDLPQPQPGRWQPLRAGLVDLFYYDNEEFFFRDGRLLLRGNNGTGKSKVLALTLPFLLDGDLSPHRVEPDADPKKRMEWNLLLGGEHPYPERLGYTWVEFGRIDDDGEPCFRTLGCGLKAVSGRGMTRHWFFVTSQRPTGGGSLGEGGGDNTADLPLIDATGTALTRDRLVDALGEHGRVYDRARDYRRAVDESLFGFGEQRYAALVDLLVHLRQPQLSKRPSEKALSAALTESLPPLDQAVVADVAEAFRSLEEDRDALTAMTEARDAAAGFLNHYRRYARIAARRKAAQPRAAEGAYRRVRDELNAAEAAHEEAVAALESADQAIGELDDARERLLAREKALRESPEMRSARELERAHEDARRAAADAERAENEHRQANTSVAGLTQRHTDAAEALTSAQDALATARQSAADSAAAARIAHDHRERIENSIDDEPDLARLRRAATELAERQQRAVKHVRGLIAAVEAAERQLAEARAKVSELEAEADDLAARRGDAEVAVSERGAVLVSAVRSHLATARELRLADQAATLAELELWVETLDGANPAGAAVSEAAHRATQELANADASFAARQETARQHSSELTAEIERLERGEVTAPPVPHTRDPQSRADGPGAPLWQLIDFADDVDAADRAGLEAALEAAGMLDAWVTPGGEMRDAGTDDVVLRAGEHVPTPVSAVLRPAVDRDDPQANAVSDGTVAGLLAAIGLGEAGGWDPRRGGREEHAQTWVSPDGRFRNGVLTGSWRKEVAEYIGRGAREAARRARLAELRAELAEVDRMLAELESERAGLAERKATLRSEVAEVPDDGSLRESHATLAGLARERERLAVRQRAATEAVTEATASAEASVEELREGADDADLPADRTALGDVEDGVQRYLVRLEALWPAVTSVRDARKGAEQAAVDLAEAAATLIRRKAEVVETRQAAEATHEHYETLRSTVGAAVADLQNGLAEVTRQLAANKADRGAAQEQANRARDDRGKAAGRREALTEELATAAEQRAESAEAFRRFAGIGLLAVALPELPVPDPAEPWAPDPTVRLARRVNDELADIADDDGAWERAQRRVNDELKTLQDTLSRQGNRAVADLREDGVVVEIEFRGKPTSVPELAEALASEVADRELLLNEREREILENHLIGEVAGTLQELVSAAEAQVAAMNSELEQRPTSTGMRLRLLWQPRDDGPTGLAEARQRLLRQTSDAWSESDRTSVGAFLQERINEVRAADTTRTWLEQLTEALDYRAWNRFVIQRHQNGQWRSATGPASGGERVLAASVPLFAAASSHYASAGNPHAPRLVTLDEAFAGVDDNARAKYLGLLTAFDLDVVMTSEREWGCYPEVPGLAISQLSRIDEVAAVLVTNWEWDGRNRTEVQRRIRSVPEQATEVPAEGLFG